MFVNNLYCNIMYICLSRNRKMNRTNSQGLLFFFLFQRVVFLCLPAHLSFPFPLILFFLSSVLINDSCKGSIAPLPSFNLFTFFVIFLFFFFLISLLLLLSFIHFFFLSALCCLEIIHDSCGNDLAVVQVMCDAF